MAGVTKPVEQKKWPNTKDDYELNHIIGAGATAIVQSAFCIPLKERCAIKRINLEKCNATPDELGKEIYAMSQCNHENVVSYYTSFVVQDELWVVMELCAGGSFLDIIKFRVKQGEKFKNGVLDEVTIATVLKEVLKGLDYLHSTNQLHRDIKAGNILMSEDGSVLIGDFGVSAWLADSATNARGEKVRHTFVGTPCWMAPEVMEQVAGYTYKADIWSFGITAIELATGTAPYHKFPPMKVLMLTLQNDPPGLDTGITEKDQYKQYSKVFRKMICECLKKDPNQRPTAHQLLKHDFFKKAKDKDTVKKLIGVDKPHVQKTKGKRAPGSSGKLHMTEDGSWEFSDDENDLNEMVENKGQTIDENSKNSCTKNNLTHNEIKQVNQLVITTPVTEKSSAETMQSTETSDKVEESVTLNLILRVRNQKQDLNDIKFEFTKGQDSADSISRELVEADLVDGKDMIVVAANLQKLLDFEDKSKGIIFALNSSGNVNETPDEKNLIGFAQLSLSD